MIDHLCEECKTHFKSVLEFLDEIELPYHLNPYLVRGLDYYTKTVFEIFLEDSQKTEAKEPSLKNALVGGGRYDSLVKLLGGEDKKASGGSMGVERVMAAMRAKEIKFPKPAPIPVFLAQLGNLAKRKSLKLLEDFRKAKIQVAETLGRDSLKAQLKTADKIGVKYTLLLGQKEALEGTIIIRDMKSGKQETVKLDKAVKEIKKRLKK
jgi:histidyl-tRNA synthetase